MGRQLDLSEGEKLQRKRDFARLRQQKFQRLRKAEQQDTTSDEMSDPTDDKLADLLPAPVIDPNVSNLNAKQLAFFASAPENDLAACAAALNVSPQSIEEFVQTTYGMTWTEYKHQRVQAAKAKAVAHVTARAALGDLRSLEVLSPETSNDPNHLSTADWAAVHQARKLRAMSDAELEAEAKRIRGLLEMTPERRLENLLAKSPGTHIVADAPAPASEHILPASPADASLPTTDDIDELIACDPLLVAPPQPQAGTPTKLTVTPQPDKPRANPNDIELEPVLAPSGARDVALDSPVGALRDACAASEGARDGNVRRKAPVTAGPQVVPLTEAVIYSPPALELKSGPGTDGLAGLMSDIQHR